MATAGIGTIKPKAPTQELGLYATRYNQGFKWDEFVAELRGRNAIRKYREMRENDAIIGAVMTAVDMMMRAVDWRIEGEDEAANEWVKNVLFEGMQHPWQTTISQAVSFLTYGFAFFEVVYERRQDGTLGIRKIASRAQWTIDEIMTDTHGDVTGFRQSGSYEQSGVVVPINKALYLCSPGLNNEPTGMSILRNAYQSYYMASHLAMVESVAIEREMAGMPVAYIPAEYLSPNATPEQKAFAEQMQRIVRDVKFNDQGGLVLPSDVYMDQDGKPTGQRMVEFSLLASNGSRAIDTNTIINRHLSNMARTILADFIMLGQSERGSFAMSKSKTDLFLTALQGHASLMADSFTKQLIKPLWALNGFNPDTMPKMVAGDVAPMDLQEMGDFIGALGRAGLQILDDETINVLRTAAGLPEASNEDMLINGND